MYIYIFKMKILNLYIYRQYYLFNNHWSHRIQIHMFGMIVVLFNIQVEKMAKMQTNIKSIMMKGLFILLLKQIFLSIFFKIFVIFCMLISVKEKVINIYKIPSKNKNMIKTKKKQILIEIYYVKMKIILLIKKKNLWKRRTCCKINE